MIIPRTNTWLVNLTCLSSWRICESSDSSPAAVVSAVSLAACQEGGGIL